MDLTILASVLGGAVGASVITAFVNWRMKLREEKHEQKRWIREKRYELYLELLSFTRNFDGLTRVDEIQDEIAQIDRMRDFYDRTKLIGSQTTLTALQGLDLLSPETKGFKSIGEKFQAVQSVQDQMRIDLGNNS